MTTPATTDLVTQTLHKVLPGGRLQRIPRNPAHRNIVLALLCRNMRRRYPYAEFEINELLTNALAQLSARVDHVTCRRYLVDFGFVKRDRAGNRYFLYYPKLEATLRADALSAAPDIIESVLADIAHAARQRQRRRPPTRGNGDAQLQ